MTAAQAYQTTQQEEVAVLVLSEVTRLLALGALAVRALPHP
jgi:hypothetical protein